MGACVNKARNGNNQQPRRKKDADKREQEDTFDEIKNAEQKKPAINGKKSRKAHHSSGDSDSDSSSDTNCSDKDTRPAEAKEPKKYRRKKNKSLIQSSTTNIKGDNFVISEAKIVNLTIDNRRMPNDRNEQPRRRDKPDLNKPDFSQLKSVNLDATGCFMQMMSRTLYVSHQKILTKVEESVGEIHASGSFIGTVFRVGPTYIMTAKHVLDGILNTANYEIGRSVRDRYHALLRNDVYVDFGHLLPGHQPTESTKFSLTRNVAFVDDELDVAVIELKAQPGREFPPEFIRFNRAIPEKKFSFIGHPQGDEKLFNQVDGPVQFSPEMYRSAVNWSNDLGQQNGFEGMENRKRLLFHCSFEKGGSGSPGIAIVDGKEAVVTMLLRGYPGWFYDPNLDQTIRDQVGKNQLIEQGVNMVALYDKMNANDISLCYAIFGKPATDPP